MKNITKKIVALAMLFGSMNAFAKSSCTAYKFTPTGVFYSDGIVPTDPSQQLTAVWASACFNHPNNTVELSPGGIVIYGQVSTGDNKNAIMASTTNPGSNYILIGTNIIGLVGYSLYGILERYDSTGRNRLHYDMLVPY